MNLKYYMIIVMFMENEWQELDDNRIFKQKCNILIVKSKDDQELVPMFCQLCQFPMKQFIDTVSYRNSKRCSMCELYWHTIQTIDKSSKEWTRYMELKIEKLKPVIVFK